jgi:hypothetical protein
MKVSSSARRALVIGVPLALGLIELTHPIVPPSDVLHHMQTHVGWWTALHILQLPLFALLAVAMALLIPDARGRAAIVARLGLAVFALFYGAFDGIAGIANGIIIQAGTELGHEAHAFTEAMVMAIFTSPATMTVMAVGILGWLVGLGGVSVTLRRRGAPGGALALLVVGGLLFGYMHAPPLGPAGLLLMTAAIAWVERSARPARAANPAMSRTA